MAMVKLETLKGEVHRFTGIVDRFGNFDNGERQVLTVCVRGLQLADNKQTVHPDHWWFILRQEFAALNLQPGDKIAFTAKIQRCNKGYQSPNNNIVKGKPKPIRTAFGPGREVRDITLLKKSRSLDKSSEEVEKQLQMQLNQEQQDKGQLLKVVEVLDKEVKNLNHLKEERLKQVETIAHLEKQIQTSFPQQQVLSGFCITALLCLITGVGLGANLNQTSPR